MAVGERGPDHRLLARNDTTTARCVIKSVRGAKSMFEDIKTPIILALLLLSACIPLTLARGEPRQGVWVTETGHQVIWHVDRPDVVAQSCHPGGPSGCVKWVPGESRMILWTIDSAAMALHECAHALAFSRAMTQAEIDAEISGPHWQFVLPFLDGPAMESPCGASAIYTGLYNEKGGRLLTLEEWQHQGLP